MTSRRRALGILSASAVAGAFALSGRAGRAQTTQTLRVSIRVQVPPVMVAPAGVFLEAVVEDPAAGRSVHGTFDAQYLPAFHEFHYLWSLPDAGPVRAPAHLVAEHRRTDRAEGPFIARVFATPGRHTVAVEVVAPDGRRGRAEAIIDVADPDTAYRAARTIVVSANGDFTGAPAHDPGNRAITLEAAMARHARLGAGPARIMLRRGQTYPSLSGPLNFKDQPAHCLISAWGEGAPPLIDLRQRGGSFIVLRPPWEGRALTLSGLDFIGGWDPTTELWQAGAHQSIVRTETEGALLLHDCREQGCAITVNARRLKAPRPGATMILLDEYTKTDFKDWLLLCPRTQSDMAITGCRVVQHPQALNGAQTRKRTSEATFGRNSHNFFRGGGRRFYVASNDIFVRHGWASRLLYDNHAFRLNRHDARGMRVVIARNHIEGMLARESAGGAVPMNILIEQNYIVANPMTRPALSFRGGAVSIRNNILLEHDTPRQPRGGGGFKSFVSLDWDGVVAATGQMPVLIHHNSFILLRRNVAPAIISQGKTPLPHVVLANNMLWAPHLGDPLGVGPLDTTSLGWDARYLGARLGWAGLIDQNLPRTLFPGDSMLVPYWTDMLGLPLSQASFAGQAGRHVIDVVIDGKRQSFDAQRGEASFAFLPDGVQITNQAPARWPEGADFRLHLDRGATPSAMQTAYGHPPGTLSLYRPVPEAGAYRAASPDVQLPRDFLGKPRMTPASLGAVEPG